MTASNRTRGGRGGLSPAALLLVVWCLAPAGLAGEVKVGRGSYSTDLPRGAKAPAGEPFVTSDATGPVPTTDWWTSLVWKRPQKPFSENLYAHPLALRAKADGLGLSFPTHAAIDPKGRSYHFHYSEDLTIGVEGLAASEVRVEGWGDWTVTAVWPGKANTLKATFGHGLPYVYCLKTGGEAVVRFQSAPTVWQNRGPTVGATVRGHHYGVFGPTGSSWQGDRELRSNLAGKAYFCLALLPDNAPATLELFRRHAFAFVTDTRVSWRYDQPKALLVTQYDAATRAMEGDEREPLLALYRHQWLHTRAKLTAHSYHSPRGAMKLLAGPSFTTEMTFDGVLPGLPGASGADPGALRGQVEEDWRGVRPMGARDTYWTGKELGRLAALVHAADQAGHTAARDGLLRTLKTELEDWLSAPDGEGGKRFCYDRTWTTLIGYPASYGSDTSLNDHQFHYGYYVMAAATVARFDRDWARPANWGGMVRLLIRDAASADRGDKLFPFLRCFDPYAGHCWASGNAAFAAGNNQESSSESLNFAAGVILFGAAAGDTALRDLGIFLYANEVRAVEQYWFDVDKAVFPEGFRHTTLGMVWSNGGAYATWWTANPEEIHGINFLPITGGSLYLGRHPDYVLRNYQDLVATNGGPEVQWADIIWSFQALADPAAAAKKLAARAGDRATSGGSGANTYLWVNALAGLGQVNTAVTADQPTAAVFQKAGTRTYVAWNPTAAAMTVTFSDGKRLPVEPGALRRAP